MTVELDTAAFDAGVKRLLVGIDRGVGPAAERTARAVAEQLRNLTPARTGRLRATVTVTGDADGASVHYGGDLPYAGYIDRRTDATATATQGADRRWLDAATRVAADQVGRL
jgi:hypothetical protein